VLLQLNGPVIGTASRPVTPEKEQNDTAANRTMNEEVCIVRRV